MHKSYFVLIVLCLFSYIISFHPFPSSLGLISEGENWSFTYNLNYYYPIGTSVYLVNNSVDKDEITIDFPNTTIYYGEVTIYNPQNMSFKLIQIKQSEREIATIPHPRGEMDSLAQNITFPFEGFQGTAKLFFDVQISPNVMNTTGNETALNFEAAINTTLHIKPLITGFKAPPFAIVNHDFDVLVNGSKAMHSFLDTEPWIERLFPQTGRYAHGYDQPIITTNNTTWRVQIHDVGQYKLGVSIKWRPPSFTPDSAAISVRQYFSIIEIGPDPTTQNTHWELLGLLGLVAFVFWKRKKSRNKL